MVAPVLGRDSSLIGAAEGVFAPLLPDPLESGMYPMAPWAGRVRRSPVGSRGAEMNRLAGVC